MKTVFPTDQISHLWAQQTLPRGKNSQGNFYFEGPTIFSYGSHFPIATFTTVRGKRVVLLTTRTERVTTMGQINDVRNALRGLDVPVFNVADFGLDAEAVQSNMVEYKDRVTETAHKALRARTNGDMLRKDTVKLHAEAMAYADLMKARKALRFECPTFDQAWIDSVKAADAARRKRDAVLIKARNAKIAAERAAAIAEWRSGESDATSLIMSVDTMLRVHGDVVQTSRGASVPVEDAKRAIRFVTIRRGKEWHRNGEQCPVGHFQLDSIDTEGNVWAGCHFIKWPEIVHLAGLLGVGV
jgi:hypothetical protein